MRMLVPPPLALLCCSCLSLSCVPVKAPGESGEEVVSRAASELDTHIPVREIRENDTEPSREYYLEGIRTRFCMKYVFPYAGMVGLGLSDKHPKHAEIRGAEQMMPWRRVAVRGGRYAGIVQGCDWEEKLP